VVLIVDEAQNMGVRGLEEVRMLSNVNAQKSHLLHLILVGQPELRELLQKPELRQLTQRVSVAYHINRLTLKEVQDYIAHRMTVAGGKPEIFQPDAVRLITHASEGIPRLINTFCDLALVYGYSEGKTAIDRHILRAVIQDRVRMGLPVGRLRRSPGKLAALQSGRVEPSSSPGGKSLLPAAAAMEAEF
jgi:type II secretory pathway predicted ATPase ExeA